MSANHYPAVFPDLLTSLNKAGRSLQKLNSNLHMSVESLDTYTRDIPRVTNALKSTQFFELVSVSEIRAAQYQLTSELEPQVKELLKHTEAGLTRLQKREQMLRTNIARRDTYQEETWEAEDEEGDDNEPNELIEEQQALLQQLRAEKQLLLKELDGLDREAKKKSVYKTVSQGF